MKQITSGLLLALVMSAWLAHGEVRLQPPRRPLIGLDHIPFVVKDLDVAATAYADMGFALKPGRFHDNGIRNSHVKFPDGSGIELLTAAHPNDRLATHYMEFLAQGEGPAYFGLHARDTNALITALEAAGIGYRQEDRMVRPADAALSFIFFGRDNRSSSDRPEHFAHANSAVAMVEVWLATDDVAAFRKLLTALGAAEKRETVFVPEPVSTTVFAVTNGKIVLLPKTHQRIEGRPIIGARFQVASLDTTGKTLERMRRSGVIAVGEGGSRELIVPPPMTHGMWLAFSEAQLAR